MRFVDKNQTLVAPDGYTFRKAESNGSFMLLTYYQTVYKTATITPIGENIIVVYLNDWGREVGRTIASYRWPEPIVVPSASMPRRFRFKNGWLIVLQGLQEIWKCLWA